MQPTLSDVHVDKPLTNISVAYVQDQDAYIATKIFPIVPVEKKTDKYFFYTKNDWFRDEAEARADGAESKGSGYGLSTDTYSCEVFAFHKDIGYQTRANADAQIDLDRDATTFITQRLLLRQEVQWVTDCFSTGKWGTDVTGGSDFTAWSNFTSGDPIEDMEQGKETVLSNTGFMPNTVVLGYQTYRKVRNHPVIIDRIKYTTGVTGKTVTPQLLAQMWDVERVLVARAVKATNKEGETAAMSFTFGKHALLAYVNPNPGLLTPSAGYTFSWRGVSAGLGSDIGITMFPIRRLKADRVEGEVAFANKIVGSDLGYFFSGAVS